MSFSTGTLSRVVLIRVPPGADIIEGIEEVCRRLDIKCGSILSCFGSLQRASFLIAVPLKNKIGAGYGDPVSLQGPLELLSGQGTIGEDEKGDVFIHLHGLLSDKETKVHGGHLIKGENPVLITCEIMIGHLEGMRILRAYDPEVDTILFSPIQGNG